MTEMAQGEVSAADTLRHIADDHPCCAAGLLDAAARIEALEKAVRLAQIRIGHGSECTDHTECRAISAALAQEKKS